jgi:iron complex outermembrane receptor protein
MSGRRSLVTAAGISVLILVLSLTAAASAATDAAPADTTATDLPVFTDVGITVTASRYDDEVHLSHTNLPTSDIRRIQSASDLPMLLQDIPGVYSYSDAGNGIGYTYLKIRGFDQRRVAVLVNGIPLNDPEDHQVYWVDLPDLASSVDDIQVQRGITNGVGGVTAIGGSVNLVADVLSDAPAGRATVEAGSYGTNRRMISYSTGDLGRGLSTGLRLSQLSSDGYRDRSGSDQWAVFWSGQWRGGAHLVQANFYTGHELSHHAWDPAPEAVLATDRTHNPEQYWNAVDDFRQPHYELHWEWDLGPSLLLRNSAYVIHGEGFYENWKDGRTAADFSLDHYFPRDGSGGFEADTETDLVRAKWVRKDQVGWAPSLMWEHAGGRLVVGGDWYTFHSNHWGDVLATGPDAGGDVLGPGDLGDGLKYHDYTGDKDAWSIYANERWEVLPGLTLLADLQLQHRRYDFMQNEVGNFTGDLRNAYTVEYDFFNPKGGLFWQTPLRPAGGELGVYGHVGVTHREPADTDYWGVWAGPDDLGQTPLFASSTPVTDGAGDVQYVQWSDAQIDEEKVTNWEGGLAWRARDVSLTVNGYWMDFENEIVPTGYWDDDNGRTARTNADKTVHRGVELGLRWRLARDHRLAVAASRSWNEYDDFVFELRDPDTGDVAYREDNSGNPIALFPDMLLSATWTSRLGPLSGDLRLRHVGRQHLDNSGRDDRVIDASTLVDLSLFLDLGRAGLRALDGMEAYVRVLNLFDEEYETYGYYDPWGGEGYQRYYTPGAPRHFLAGVNYDF